MKKISVKPISVSDIKPVSFNGHIDGWNVCVRFDGDLALWHNENPLPRNAYQFRKYMNWTDADIEKMEDDEVNGGHKSIERMFFEFQKEMSCLYENEKLYILDPRLDIPQRKNISTVSWDAGSVKGDNKYANTLVNYVFDRGRFGFGLRRAGNLLEKILAQMAEKNR